MSDMIKIADTLSAVQRLKLLWHINNDNHSPDFGVSFRSNGNVCYKRPSRLFVGRAIAAAVATSEGDVVAGHEVAFIPFCGNGWRDRSRWAGVKFYSEAGEAATQRRAERALNRLCARASGFSLILERAGDGSWQLWVISEGFSSFRTWHKLLEPVTVDACIDVNSLGCELFPDRHLALGMPAPGSWDPQSQTFNQVVYANLAPFIARPLYTRP
jgi:hypothetical protein